MYTTIDDAYRAYCEMFGSEGPVWDGQRFREYRFEKGTRYEDIDVEWLCRAVEDSLDEPA